jgi:hypothetical protein
MSALTTTRHAIVAALSGQATLPADWHDGMLSPPVERGDTGCSWIAGTREVSGHVDIEEVTVMIRLLSSTQRGRGAKSSLDPAKLEQWRDDVATILSGQQTTLGGWYLRVTGSTIDPRLGMVDVSIVVRQDNVFRSI